MTKAAALYQFFSSFGLDAWEENSIYDTDEQITYPYITYELTTDSYNDGQTVPLSASLWYRSASPSLVPINAKTDEISQAVGNGKTLKVDGGYIRIEKGHPFAQTMGQDADELVKRKLLSFTARFFTEY